MLSLAADEDPLEIKPEAGTLADPVLVVKSRLKKGTFTSESDQETVTKLYVDYVKRIASRLQTTLALATAEDAQLTLPPYPLWARRLQTYYRSWSSIPRTIRMWDLGRLWKVPRRRLKNTYAKINRALSPAAGPPTPGVPSFLPSHRVAERERAPSLARAENSSCGKCAASSLSRRLARRGRRSLRAQARCW